MATGMRQLRIFATLLLSLFWHNFAGLVKGLFFLAFVSEFSISAVTPDDAVGTATALREIFSAVLFFVSR